MGCARNERTKKWPLPTQECRPTDLDRIKVTFTDSGKGDTPRWIQGRRWGLVYYKYGGHSGLIVVIRLKIEPIGPPPKTVGRNKVLKPPHAELPLQPPLQSRTTSAPPHPRTKANVKTLGLLSTGSPRERHPHAMLGAPDPLWNLVNAAFLTLNHTDPNMTTSCWLCYDVRPPFYEAIGLNVTYNALIHENPTQ
jgi:hypothetical protein